MASISIPTALSIGTAAAGIGGSLLSSSAASSAADKQSAAADQASALQAAQFQQTQDNLAPYRALGQTALGGFDQNTIDDFTKNRSPSAGAAGAINEAYIALPTSVQPGQVPNMAAYTPLPTRMDQATLEATPGYQFALSQGLKSVQNSASARGLGVSGAAMKGAADYATGLADNTYQKQFANQQTIFGDAYNQNQQQFRNANEQYGLTLNAQQQQFGQNQVRESDLMGLNNANQGNLQAAYNRLVGITTIGQNSAATTGTLGAQSASAQGNYLTSGANAQGAAQIAGGNALSSGLNTAANAYGQYVNYNRLYGAGSPGSASSNFDPAYFPTVPSGGGGSFSGSGFSG